MSEDSAHSLLFLSCDLVGSTKFKQQADTQWQRTFLSFYREFPQILGDLTREAGYEPGFELWKAVGDELIFTTRVDHENQIFRAVRIWLQAMQRYETEVLNDVDLATKGGAFVATFPGPDSESSIPRNPQSETSDKGVVELNDDALAIRRPDVYLYDYFGPSIDTGFRVVGACSQRYFTLSVEVALAMSQCTADGGVSNSAYAFEDVLLLDSIVFKGVWRGREYPLFALDREAGDSINVAMEKITSRSLPALDVLNLCRACSGDTQWPSRLYLPRSGHDDFRVEPSDSLEGLRLNNMEGAETVPAEVGDDELEDDAPLGQ